MMLVQPHLDLLTLTQKLQLHPIYSNRNLIIDSYILGFAYGKSVEQERMREISLTMKAVEDLNNRLYQETISFEQKLLIYQACLQYNQNLQQALTEFDKNSVQKQTNIFQAEKVSFQNPIEPRNTSDFQPKEPSNQTIHIGQTWVNRFHQINFYQGLQGQQQQQQQKKAIITIQEINRQQYYQEKLEQPQFQKFEQLEQFEQNEQEQEEVDQNQEEVESQSMLSSIIALGVDCPICMDGLSLNKISPLSSCSHIFHKTCLQQSFKQKIHERQFPLVCPQCQVEVEIFDLKDILGLETFQKFQDITFKDFIDKHQNDIKYCLTPDCEYAFMASNEIKFDCPVCKVSYCLNCNAPQHRNMTCQEFQSSRKEDENDLRFNSLIRKKQFKQCQRCNFVVEKNEGCNHMTCRCGYQFCYLCGAEHGTCGCGQNGRQIVQQNVVREGQRVIHGGQRVLSDVNKLINRFFNPRKRRRN